MKYLIHIFLLMFSAEALSLSCTPTYEYLVVECNHDYCVNGLHVNEVETDTTCGRRPIVTSASEWKLKLAFYALENSKKISFEPGFYEIKHYPLYHRITSASWIVESEFERLEHWPNKGDLPKLLQDFLHTKNPSLFRNELFLQELDKLDLLYSDITRINVKNLSELADQWKKDELYGQLFVLYLLFIKWGVFLLFVSIGLYTSYKIICFIKNTGWKINSTNWIKWGIPIQLSLIVIPITWFVHELNGWGPYHSYPTTMVSPAMIAVLLCETVYFLFVVIKDRKIGKERDQKIYNKRT